MMQNNVCFRVTEVFLQEKFAAEGRAGWITGCAAGGLPAPAVSVSTAAVLHYTTSTKITTSLPSSSSSVKLVQCPYCPYSTAVVTNLKNHMLTHTGETPFACPLCPYRAKQKGNVKRHMMIHHSCDKSSQNSK